MLYTHVCLLCMYTIIIHYDITFIKYMYIIINQKKCFVSFYDFFDYYSYEKLLALYYIYFILASKFN